MCLEVILVEDIHSQEQKNARIFMMKRFHVAE